MLLCVCVFETGVPEGKNPETYALGRCPHFQNAQKSQLVEQIIQKKPKSPGLRPNVKEEEWGGGGGRVA